MIGFFLAAFVIILFVGLHEVIMDWKEASYWAVAFAASFGGLFIKSQFYYCFCFAVLFIDAALVLRVFGRDIKIPR